MMKNKLKLVLPVLIGLAGCTSTPSVLVTVQNPSAFQRENELVEVSWKALERLNLHEGEPFVVLSEKGEQLPYQLTYDSLLLFPVSVAAGQTAVYRLQPGTPEAFDTVCYGRVYPERLDDMAWENDKAAYRAYGPSLQRKGERAYGYDVMTKSVGYPVLEMRYRQELDPQAWARVDSLRKAGNRAAADSIVHAISYHVDHGNGMDCYSVGPTLGGGTAALMPDSSIVYPYCYQQGEVLDNGPLRVTIRLVYAPMPVKEDTAVVETRLISLNQGSHLNRTVVRYDRLSASCPVASGIVIHPQHPDGYILDPEKRYIAYADSTDNPANGNGVIYLGAVYPSAADEVTVKLFPEKERKERAGALGHVLGISEYAPGASFTYYWGSGWSKAGIKDVKDWEAYLQEYVHKLDHPLQVTIK